MNNSTTSKADNYRKTVQRRMDGGVGGTGVMITIIVLSAILSAIFFWKHSQAVFAGLPSIAAVTLGLLVGLVPSEGAFFGWKKIRQTKEDMTKWQVKFSAAGLWCGVLFAVMNVVALFLTSFPEIPLAVQEIAPWLALIALLVPIPAQFLLYAGFVTNEQSVIESTQRARLNAATHAAAVLAEEARIGAVLEGMDAELNDTLDDYGATTGRENAQTALRSGVRDIVAGFYDRMHRRPNSEQSNNTHNAVSAHAAPSAGQGDAPRLSADDLAAMQQAMREMLRKELEAEGILSPTPSANGQEVKPSRPH